MMTELSVISLNVKTAECHFNIWQEIVQYNNVSQMCKHSKITFSSWKHMPNRRLADVRARYEAAFVACWKYDSLFQYLNIHNSKFLNDYSNLCGQNNYPSNYQRSLKKVWMVVDSLGHLIACKCGMSHTCE